MNEHDNTPDSAATDWLERFFAAEPGGGADEFESWADSNANLRANTLLRAEVLQLLTEWLRAADLIAGDLHGAASPSVFVGEQHTPRTTGVARALEPGQRVAHFTLRRFLASGGMGQVWEAQDENLRKLVALKLVLPHRIDERSLKMFAREARAGGRLQHPNLVATLAFGTDDGLAWIAQELVGDAWTLKHSLEKLRAQDGLPADYFTQSAELAAQLADGLAAAHAAGVIHRDVKPANVLLTKAGLPKLTDFGLARVVDDSFHSRDGDLAGTWAYMSPEQVQAKHRELDERTDIFSLGVVLYEMLTLRRPFEGDTTHQIATQILHVDPPRATALRSRCPVELGLIAAKALEKQPASRYASMAEFAADLRRHLSHEPIHARPPGPLARVGKWVRRHPAQSSALAIAVIALVIVSGLLARIAGTNRLLEQSAESLAGQTRIAEQRAADVLSLSSMRDVRRLTVEADTLWPAHPDKIHEYERWLQEARVLLDGSELQPSLVARAEQLEQLGARDEQANIWWREQLTELVAAIESLHDVETGLAGDHDTPTNGWGIAKRLRLARSLEEHSDDEARSLWPEAIAAIAKSPHYDGLQLAPQLGLLPIGADPHSGLWEFAHVQSGAAAVRDETGELVRDDNTGIVLVLVPGGTFTMGAQASDSAAPNFDSHARSSEGPPRTVNLSPYFLSKYELTQGQWLAFTGSNPALYSPDHNSTVTLVHPIEQVHWTDCNSLLRKLGLTLPSDAQWEYAARAGTSTVWWTGDDKLSLDGAVNLADSTAQRAGAPWPDIADWPELDDGAIVHAAAGSYRANPFGLHDMVSNVGEWCLDVFLLGGSGAVADIDPVGTATAEERLRVRRGAEYATRADDGRSAFRIGHDLEHTSVGLGTRAALAVQKAK